MRKCWPLRQKMSTDHMSDQHLPLEIGLCSYRICNVAKKCLGHFTQWHIKLQCWMTAVVGVNTRGCGWLGDVSDGTNACMPDKTPGFISAAILPNICNVSSDLLFSCESISDFFSLKIHFMTYLMGPRKTNPHLSWVYRSALRQAHYPKDQVPIFP